MQACYSYASLSRNHAAGRHGPHKAPTFLPRRYCDVSAAKWGKMQIRHTMTRGFADILLSSREVDRTNIESREESVKKDLTLRLKGICEHLSKVEFDVLVTDMTREQLRGESTPGRRIRPS